MQHIEIESVKLVIFLRAEKLALWGHLIMAYNEAMACNLEKPTIFFGKLRFLVYVF